MFELFKKYLKYGILKQRSINNSKMDIIIGGNMEKRDLEKIIIENQKIINDLWRSL